MKPRNLNEILDRANEKKFELSCDLETGQLLRVLASSKRNGKFLELGTGAGASTVWILDGMDFSSQLISVEIDEAIQNIAKSVITDERVKFITTDGGVFIEDNKHQKYDFIFADTWPGKFCYLKETLMMINSGGFYIIDDLKPTNTWSKEHAKSVDDLVNTIRGLEDFEIVELDWSTGLIIATRK